MNFKNKHICYIVGMVLSLIAVIPVVPTVLKYLLAIIPVLFFGADLTLQYMQEFYKKKYINKFMTGIIVGLGLIIIGKIGYAAMTMLLFSAGDYYFNMLLDKASRRIEDTSRITAPYARVMSNNGAVRVSAASVAPGQTLLVEEGDIIPCDCSVVNGEAVVDYTNLFGNSDPRSVKAGTYCFSGGIVQQGRVAVKVLKPASQSLGAVANAYTKKAAKPSPLQNQIKLIASIFEPAVYLFSFLLFVIFWIVTKDFALAVHQAVSILIVSSVTGVTKLLPVLNRNALLCGRRRGVIFSDIGSLEQCGNIKTVSMNEAVSEDVWAMIDQTGAVPAKGGYTKDDAVVYRDKAQLENDPNPCFKLALGFFSPKAQGTAIDSKPERIAGAVRTGRNHKETMILNFACILAQKLALVALIFLLNINPVAAVIIEFAAWMFCLFNSTKEI